jgi:threonine dehydrogenase-like Zn-dependent dehydrogenase
VLHSRAAARNPGGRLFAMLLPLVQSGTFDPSRLLTQSTPLVDVLDAYERFDQREEGWIKVMLDLQPA